MGALFSIGWNVDRPLFHELLMDGCCDVGEPCPLGAGDCLGNDQLCSGSLICGVDNCHTLHPDKFDGSNTSRDCCVGAFLDWMYVFRIHVAYATKSRFCDETLMSSSSRTKMLFNCCIHRCGTSKGFLAALFLVVVSDIVHALHWNKISSAGRNRITRLHASISICNCPVCVCCLRRTSDFTLGRGCSSPRVVTDGIP